jgi:hypothetical protein
VSKPRTKKKKSTTRAAAPKKAPKKASKKPSQKPRAKAAPKRSSAPKKARPTKKVRPARKVPAAKRAPTKSAAAIAKKAKKQAASSVEREPRAFIGGHVTSDALAEELAENAVRAMTTGQDEEGERDGDAEREAGGPFVVSSGSREYRRDDEAPNVASAEPAAFPTTRDDGADADED